MLHASLGPNLVSFQSADGEMERKTPECDDVEHRGERTKGSPMTRINNVSFVGGSRTRGEPSGSRHIFAYQAGVLYRRCILVLRPTSPALQDRRGQRKLCKNKKPSRVGFPFEVLGRGSGRASCEPAADWMASPLRVAWKSLCSAAAGGASPPWIIIRTQLSEEPLQRVCLCFVLILTCDQNRFDLNPGRVPLLNIYTSDVQPGVQRQ